MSTSAPKNAPSGTPTGGDAQPERVYVKLPATRSAGARRGSRQRPNVLFQRAGELFALVLCVSLPAAPAIILFLLLFQPGTPRHGLLWLWIAMILFILPIAILCASGIWREVMGWSGRRDYLR
jgi:hypothetical protein